MGTDMEWKFSEERPLRVVTLCSGYDSQLMAIRNLGIPYECVGWSEIDKYAIMLIMPCSRSCGTGIWAI